MESVKSLFFLLFITSVMTVSAQYNDQVLNAFSESYVFEKNGDAIRILFSDIMLPDRSGIELAQELCSRSPGLQVILTSGYADQHAAWPDIKGRFCFLQKPFSIVALLQALQKALSGHC